MRDEREGARGSGCPRGVAWVHCDEWFHTTLLARIGERERERVSTSVNGMRRPELKMKKERECEEEGEERSVAANSRRSS
eukprot:scaffold46908_cov27-Tisochrysis_lutea.AAC.2